MAQLDRNVKGEVLMPGRVSDCYLGRRLDPRGQSQPPDVLVVASAALLHPVVPQPDGTVLYELVPGHPDRTSAVRTASPGGRSFGCSVDTAAESGHRILPQPSGQSQPDSKSMPQAASRCRPGSSHRSRPHTGVVPGSSPDAAPNEQRPARPGSSACGCFGGRRRAVETTDLQPRRAASLAARTRRRSATSVSCSSTPSVARNCRCDSSATGRS